MTTVAPHPNGINPSPQVQAEKSVPSAANHVPIIIPDKTSRILCVADIRGDCKSTSPFLSSYPSSLLRASEQHTRDEQAVESPPAANGDQTTS